MSPTTADGIVTFVTGNNADTDALIATAKAQLPPYIVPRRIYTLSEMPLNTKANVNGIAHERLRSGAVK